MTSGSGEGRGLVIGGVRCRQIQSVTFVTDVCVLGYLRLPVVVHLQHAETESSHVSVEA